MSQPFSVIGQYKLFHRQLILSQICVKYVLVKFLKLELHFYILRYNTVMISWYALHYVNSILVGHFFHFKHEEVNICEHCVGLLGQHFIILCTLKCIFHTCSFTNFKGLFCLHYSQHLMCTMQYETDDQSSETYC
jgi:hypothetical protein